MSTFSTLRALHALIGDAIDDIHRVFTDSPPSSPRKFDFYPSSPYKQRFSSPSPRELSFPSPSTCTFPSPSTSDFPCSSLDREIDFPNPYVPYDPSSPAELLAVHPQAAAAASRIVAACGQLATIVQKPFLVLCDASMGYNLPASLRLLEHIHIVEILREAEDARLFAPPSSPNFLLPCSPPVDPTHGSAPGSPWIQANPDASSQTMVNKLPDLSEGLHVNDIARIIRENTNTARVDEVRLAHALRLLATHHLLRETAPDVFAGSRVSSLLDTGKTVASCFANPGKKYEDTDGVAAFVGLCTDELFKSAAYLTEAFTGVQLNPDVPGSAPPPKSMRNESAKTSGIPPFNCPACNSPLLSSIPSASVPAPSIKAENTRPEFNLNIFNHNINVATNSKVESISPLSNPKPLPQIDPETIETLPAFNIAFQTSAPFFEWLEDGGKDVRAGRSVEVIDPVINIQRPIREGDAHHLGRQSEDPAKPSTFRLDRFSKAMTGTTGWEAPGAILSGFDWSSLPQGATIVDVGGGIGSTTMLLARAFGGNSAKGETGSDGSSRRSGGSGGSVGSSVDMCFGDGPGLSRRREASCHGRHRRSVSQSQTQSGLGESNIHSFSPSSRRKPSFTPKDFENDTGTPLAANDSYASDGQDSNRDYKFHFVVQDRPVVVGLGLQAWRAQCPEMLDEGRVEFQEHDFFAPQPVLRPALFLLRVVLHDWPDDAARRILLRLRDAAGDETKLIIADHVLPLACVDEEVSEKDGQRKSRRGKAKSQKGRKHLEEEDQGTNDEILDDDTTEWTLHTILTHLQGAEKTLAPAPLLPNLGKASANAYWLDLTMHSIFNGKERTLRELCALALSAGWRATRITRAEGSVFGHLVCEPIDIPLSPSPSPQHSLFTHSSHSLDSESVGSPDIPNGFSSRTPLHPLLINPHPVQPVTALLPSPILERSSSRCGTPTFGSRISLPRPEDMDEKIAGGKGGKGIGAGRRWLKARGLGVRGVIASRNAAGMTEGQQALGISAGLGSSAAVAMAFPIGATQASSDNEVQIPNIRATQCHSSSSQSLTSSAAVVQASSANVVAQTSPATRAWWKKAVPAETTTFTKLAQPNVIQTPPPTRKRRTTISQQNPRDDVVQPSTPIALKTSLSTNFTPSTPSARFVCTPSTPSNSSSALPNSFTPVGILQTPRTDSASGYSSDATSASNTSMSGLPRRPSVLELRRKLSFAAFTNSRDGPRSQYRSDATREDGGVVDLTPRRDQGQDKQESRLKRPVSIVAGPKNQSSGSLLKNESSDRGLRTQPGASSLRVQPGIPSMKHHPSPVDFRHGLPSPSSPLTGTLSDSPIRSLFPGSLTMNRTPSAPSTSNAPILAATRQSSIPGLRRPPSPPDMTIRPETPPSLRVDEPRSSRPTMPAFMRDPSVPAFLRDPNYPGYYDSGSPGPGVHKGGTGAPIVKPQPSIPALPRKLSIPILRRRYNSVTHEPPQDIPQDIGQSLRSPR